MDLLSALARGEHGVRVDVALPAGLAVQTETPLAWVAHDPVRRNRVDLTLAPGWPLVLAEAHRAELGRALEAYARALFARTFRPSGEGPLASTRPRTDDPTWSPLVDVEHLVLGGQPALRTVHRMAYERGREIVMGHLLVPLATGLLELRVLAADLVTGARESALLLARPDQGRGGFPPASYYDEPAHDAVFPEHVLSRVRAALRRFVAEGGWRIDAPAPAYVHAEVALPAPGVALLPPPRFVPVARADDDGFACFRRVSFCATDGLEELVVARRGAPLAGTTLAHLRAFAERDTPALIGDDAPAELYFEDLAPVGGRPQLLALASLPGRRLALRWILDETRRPAVAFIDATPAVADEVRLVELDGVARSWRPLA